MVLTLCLNADSLGDIEDLAGSNFLAITSARSSDATFEAKSIP
jgi:hypothetical protein